MNYKTYILKKYSRRFLVIQPDHSVGLISQQVALLVVVLRFTYVCSGDKDIATELISWLRIYIALTPSPVDPFIHQVMRKALV